MRIATTILLLLLVAGIGGFIVLKERAMVSTGEFERRSGLLLDVQPPEVASVELSTAKHTIVVARSEYGGRAVHGGEGGWVARGDLEDRVDPGWIEALLDAVASLEVVAELDASTTAAEKKELGPSGTGFGGGAVGSIVVNRIDGRVDALEIGASGALGGTVHLRREGTAGPIFLVRSSLRDFTHGDIQAIRDRRLWLGKPSEVLGFSYWCGQGEVAFHRGSPDEYWRLERPLQTEASDATVQSLLEILAEVRAEEFPQDHGEFPEDEVAGENMIVLKLPAEVGAAGVTEEEGAGDRLVDDLTIRFWREDLPGSGAKDGLVAADQLDAPTWRVYARCSERGVVMAIDPKIWNALNFVTDDFRSPTLARIDPGAVAAVRIATGEETRVQLKKSGERWMVDRGGRWHRANGARVERLIETINRAQILDFAANSSSALGEFGLDEPFLSLTLASDMDARGETLDFGAGEEAIYACWRGDPFIFQVSASVVGEIPVDTVKWKHLTVLQFAIFSLRGMRISPGGAPPLELHYDYRDARWQGSRAGVDVSELIDPARAEMIAAQIGSLIAIDWLADSAVGFAALRSPELVVDVSLIPPSEAPVRAEREILELQISFAPAGALGVDSPLYYGAVKGMPEVFLVRRETVKMLATPPLKGIDEG
jgi:hypothetical protein